MSKDQKDLLDKSIAFLQKREGIDKVMLGLGVCLVAGEEGGAGDLSTAVHTNTCPEPSRRP